MTTPSDALATSLAHRRGADAPERRDRAAAVQLIHDLDAAGIVLRRRAGAASPAALTWTVATAIHRRGCGDAACGGPHEHLPAAAVAVGLLADRTTARAAPDGARLSPVA